MSDETPGSYSAEWTRKNVAGESETVSGSLEITDDAPTHLIHLTKDFDESADGMSFLSNAAETEIYPVIHGRTQTGSYTAIDSRPYRSHRRMGGGLSDIVLQPFLMIKGDVLLHEHELAITEVNLRFWDQDDWAEWHLWAIQRPTKDNPDVLITQKAIREHSVRIGGAVISMKDGSQRNYLPSSGTLMLKQHSTLNFKFDDPIQLRDFIADWMRPASFWITSGTRRRSGIEMMWITNSGWASDSDGSPLNTWLEVHPRNPINKNRKSKPTEFLHKFKNFDFERQLPLVIESFNAHETAIEQFLDYLHSPPRTSIGQLTTLAQLVETFDRSLNPDPDASAEQKAAAASVKALMNADPLLKGFARKAAQGIAEHHRPNLESRLSRLDRQAGKLVSKVLLRPTWNQDIANVRNSAVHGLPSSSFFTRNVIPLQISVDILRIVFEARLLVAMGFTPAQVEKLITENDPRWYGTKHSITEHLDSFDDFKAYRT